MILITQQHGGCAPSFPLQVLNTTAADNWTERNSQEGGLQIPHFCEARLEHLKGLTSNTEPVWRAGCFHIRNQVSELQLWTSKKREGKKKFWQHWGTSSETKDRDTCAKFSKILVERSSSCICTLFVSSAHMLPGWIGRGPTRPWVWNGKRHGGTGLWGGGMLGVGKGSEFSLAKPLFPETPFLSMSEEGSALPSVSQDQQTAPRTAPWGGTDFGPALPPMCLGVWWTLDIVIPAN